MNFHFKPLLWFVCRICRQTFPNSEKLLSHKLENHLGDCLGIKSIIFEERFLDEEEIPVNAYDIYFKPKSPKKDSILPVPLTLPQAEPEFELDSQPSSNSSSSAAQRVMVIPTKPRQNPYVLLQRLTTQEIESALGSKHALKMEFDFNSKGRKRLINSKTNRHPKNDEDENDNDDDDYPKAKHHRLQNTSANCSLPEDATDTRFDAVDSVTQEEHANAFPTEIKIERSPSPSISVASVCHGPGSFNCGSQSTNTNKKQSEKHEKFGKFDDSMNGIQVCSNSDSDCEFIYNANLVCSSNDENVSDSDWGEHLPKRKSKSNSSHRKLKCTNENVNKQNSFSALAITITPSKSVSTLTSILQNKKPKYDSQFISENSSSIFSTARAAQLGKHESESHRQSTTDLIVPNFEPLHLSGLENFIKNAPLEYTIKCRLCFRQLVSQPVIKNHAKNCWLHNKNRHRFCVFCHLEFESSLKLRRHNLSEHYENDLRQVGSSPEKNKMIQLQLPLYQWLRKYAQAFPTTIIVLQPNPLQVKGNTFVVSEERPLTCKLCELKLTSESQVKTHVADCWDNNKSRHRYCIPCKITFAFTKGLKRHNNSKHSIHNKHIDPKCYHCLVCEKKFLEEEEFLKHEESLKEFQSLEKKSDYADDDDAYPVTALELNSKQKQNQLPLRVLKPYICPICSTRFSQRNGLSRHMTTHSDNRPHECPHCSETYKRKESLRRHLSSIHGIGTVYKCTFCSKPFSSKDILLIHERSHTGERPFKCQVQNCLASYATRNGLSLHRCSKHWKELELARHLCPICGKSFTLKAHLKMHNLRFHSTEMPYKCSEGCSKGFKSKIERDEHERIHTGEKPYQCDECGMAFAKKWSFTKHCKVHAGTLSKYHCHLCPRKLTSKNGLEKHSRAHEKGSNFFCKICGHVCKNKKYLKVHERAHGASKGKSILNEGNDDDDDENFDEDSFSGEDVESESESDVENQNESGHPVEAHVEIEVGDEVTISQEEEEKKKRTN